MFSKLKAIDWHLHHEYPLLALWLILVILRFPNFLEPYWYGDEAIYLTIGVAMRQGALLYKDIIDHKTPLIYYLAMTPTQAYFRLLLTSWMLAATTAFYYLCLRLMKSLRFTVLTTLLFILVTTLPWFEGNIPNGELFVMGFVLVAISLLLNTKLYQNFFALDPTLVKATKNHHPILQIISNTLHNTHDVLLFVASGFLLGLAVLTKVPALFDATGLLTVSWFTLTNTFTFRRLADWRLNVVQVITQSSLIAIGILLPILLSIVYYALRGTLPQYLEYGLLYNFRYIQAWGLPFNDPLLVWLFSFQGKIAVVVVSLVVLSCLKKWLTPAFQFALGWFVFALFATLLSSRPYPHYFLQIMPPLMVVIGLVLQKLYQFKKTTPPQKHDFASYLLPTLLGILAVVTSVMIMLLLNVGLYPTFKYYRNSLAYLTNQLSQDEYYQGFDRLMGDNYAAAEIIRGSNDPHLFIWGTNPLLYALAEKSPTGRFTVSFHIKDFKAQTETLADLQADQPKYVVVMNGEEELPGLKEYLFAHYIVNSNFEHFSLWQRWENLPD